MKKYLISGLFFLMSIGTFSSFAQRQEISYFFKEVPNLSNLNPAMTPSSGFYVSLLAAPSFGFNTSGFCYHDIINRHPQYPDSLRIDVDGFMDKLKRNNYLAFEYEHGLFGIDYKARNT